MDLKPNEVMSGAAEKLRKHQSSRYYILQVGGWILGRRRWRLNGREKAEKCVRERNVLSIESQKKNNNIKNNYLSV
jgi:hypothetical protein